MGTTDMGKLCNTCGLNNMGCPGHFGHIELARPVYNYQFMDIIVKILKCICFRCSKLLINKDKPIIESICKKNNRDRWDEICKLCSNISRCGQETENGCGCKQPDRYKPIPIVGIEAIWKSMDQKQIIQAEYVKTLFEKITDEDCNLLGFSSTWCRPEWLICSVVPVPPPAVRPSVKQGDSQRMDDDLTHKLSDIIQFNNGLKKKIESECRSEIIDDWTNQVQYHVATLIDNELPGVNQSTHRSGRPLKSICQR
jgi:DNA-directed RNA polymerase II subunit RPB1